MFGGEGFLIEPTSDNKKIIILSCLACQDFGESGSGLVGRSANQDVVLRTTTTGTIKFCSSF